MSRTVSGDNQSRSEYYLSVKKAPEFGMRDKIGYLLGDFGFNAVQVLINIYYMVFCVDILGIRQGHFAIIIGLCRFMDAFIDPWIGNVVDSRDGNKFGKYKQYIPRFALLYALFTVFLFVDIGSLNYTLKCVLALIFYIIWAFVASFINIPYGTMLNSITSDLELRTQLSNARSIGSTLGNVITTTIVPLLIFDKMNKPTAKGFMIATVILCVFMLVCLYFTTTLTYERVLVPNKSKESEKIDYKKFFKGFIKNRPMIAVVLAYIIVKFFIQTTGLMNNYVYMTYYKNTTLLSAIGLGTLIPTIAAMLMLNPLINRFGKKKLMSYSSLLAAIVYAINAFAPVSELQYIIVQLIGNFFTGFFSLLVWSFIADAVDYQTYVTGEKNDGTTYSVVQFLVFTVSSLSTSLISVLLELVGYDPGLGAEQAVSVANNIKFLGGLLPAIGAILIYVCFSMVYNVSDKEMQEVSLAVHEKYSVE